MQAFHQQKVLFIKQRVSDTNSLSVLAKITNTPQLKPQPVHMPPCNGNNAHTTTQ